LNKVIDFSGLVFAAMPRLSGIVATSHRFRDGGMSLANACLLTHRA